MKRALTTNNVRSILRECGLLKNSRTVGTASSQPRKVQPAFSNSTRCMGTGVGVNPGDIRSSFSDVEIPDCSFGEVILKRCDEFKDMVAVVSRGAHRF